MSMYTGINIDSFDWPNSCFHRPNVFKFEGQYYEFIADPEYVDPCYDHPFRIILGEDDYDYVEDKDLINRLTRAWDSLGRKK